MQEDMKYIHKVKNIRAKLKNKIFNTVYLYISLWKIQILIFVINGILKGHNTENLEIVS